MYGHWQAETTVLNQCTQLLSSSADPTYVMTYINHSFPQHRQYLCSGAWILMYGHPESINSIHLVSFSRHKMQEVYYDWEHCSVARNML